jgi:hypothetical protein
VADASKAEEWAGLCAERTPVMRHNTMLRITSLLSILLLTLHVTHDIVLGISKADRSNFYAVFYFVILLCGPLLFAERRLGYVIMFIGGVCESARLRRISPLPDSVLLLAQ